MVSEAPPFWWQKAGWQAWALSPLSVLYGQVAGRRMRKARRAEVAAPVLCVGNFTVGGAGKTPTAIAIAEAAHKRGLKPGFLSRGYGGTLDVTTLVDATRHRAVDVGDEPLLLARHATTVISRRRVDGAHRLVAEGVDLIIMDDGFQSARLTIDYALLVIDTGRGIGNGHLVPGGPVRAPLDEQMRQASAIVKVGRGQAADRLIRTAARAAKPIFVAAITPRKMEGIAGLPVLAFAGIADPGKFFRTVESLGAEIVLSRAFPDHHGFSDEEASDLLTLAARDGLVPVTTAKDAVRLAGRAGPAADLVRQARVVEVDMVFDDPAAIDQMIDATIANARRRRLASPPQSDR